MTVPRRPPFDYGPLITSLKNAIDEKGLQPVPIFIKKNIELYEMICADSVYFNFNLKLRRWRQRNATPTRRRRRGCRSVYTSCERAVAVSRRRPCHAGRRSTTVPSSRP